VDDVVVGEIVVVVAAAAAAVDNTVDVAGDGGAIVVVVVVVAPVIVVDDACYLKLNSWNYSQQVFLVVAVVVAAAVDHIRIRMDVVERLHKRFVLTFVDDVVDDDDVVVDVHEPLHHCYCYYRESPVLSSV
jgi:hypothetical protein